MKIRGAGSILVWSCSAVLALSGCHRNKPVVLLPQEPPATTSPQQTTQEKQQNPPQQPPATTQQPQQQTAENKPAPPKPKPAAKHPRQHTSNNNKKPENKPEKTAQEKAAPEKNTQEVAKNNPPGRIVIKESTPAAPPTIQIAPAMTHDEAGHSQATTGQLLDSTDANLRQITRQLSASEQSMLAQCKDYETQSREAVKNGDMERAHNLALKAHLLSDELVKTH
jgi:hypothetical protein